MQVQTDSTCLLVLSSDTLLQAVGNQLILFSVDAGGVTRREPLRNLPRFKDKIHGIDCRLINSSETEEPRWFIAFHAGREAYSMVLGKGNTSSHLHRICLYNCVEEVLYFPKNQTLMTQATRRINDWISSLKVLDGNTVCLITGHGVAGYFYQNNAGQWMCLHKCACEDGSTLYCSKIVGSRWESLLCFSGTALGLLIVWRVFGPHKGQILRSIQAHKGVVFSIDCDLERNFLTTTSDDRSVKFWNITLSEDDDGVNLNELMYSFGHTARVFRSRIIRAYDKVWVISIGEDSYLCLWEQSGRLIHKRKLEDGATLWNLDYDDRTMTVFVCASNGNLSKLELRQYLESKHAEPDIRDITPTLYGDHLAKVKFLSNGSIVVVTSGDRILLLDGMHEPHIIENRLQFKCSILEVSYNKIFVAGNQTLNIYEVEPSQDESISCATLLKQLEVNFDQSCFSRALEEVKFGIIRSLHVCDNSGLVLCDNNGRCLVYDLDVETLKSCHRLPRTAERWLTFALCLDQYLLLADRSGNLYLFVHSQSDPIFRLPYVHGKLGITHIELDEQTSEGDFLTSAGHDGHLKTIFFDRSKLRLQVFEERRTAVRWIDRVCRSDRLIVGFNDSHFVVAQNEQDELFTVDCGGGHRYWDFLFSHDTGRFLFVFIHHKRLKLLSSVLRGANSLNALEVPRLCWHTKACNVVKILRGTHRDMLFVSGGEDNVLRINVFCAETRSLQEYPRKHLYCHLSSIKTILSFGPMANDGKVLILSAGGRAQLCLTSLDPSKPERTKQELCYMMHSTDFDRSRWRTNRTASLDPETRFMSAVLVEGDAFQGSIFIGCSDGYLRKFVLRRNEDQFTVDPDVEVFYGRCILHLAKLTIGTQTVLLTMATDGFVCFWSTESLAEPFHKLKHHASGVNAFDLLRLDGDQGFLIGTGGDDQTVAVTQFRVTVGKDGRMSIDHRGTVKGEGIHIGQVTGIKFDGPGALWSAGVDQRVCRLDISGREKMTVLESLNTCVADVKGLEIVQESQCLFVYGWGFEFIDLKI